MVFFPLFILDINECLFGRFPCGQNAKCINNDGGYECVCPDNLIGDAKVQCKCKHCFYLFDVTLVILLCIFNLNGIKFICKNVKCSVKFIFL